MTGASGCGVSSYTATGPALEKLLQPVASTRWTWGYIKLARTEALQENCKEAFENAASAERRIEGGVGALSRSWLGSTHAICGDVTRAREKLGELHAFEAKRYLDPAAFADIHASLGEIDQAVDWYRKASEDTHRTWCMRVSPADSIRSWPPILATGKSSRR